MSAPWWGKESIPWIARFVRGSGSTPNSPELMTATREAIASEIRSRIPSYTPEWTNFRAGDPGITLVQLFSELTVPISKRLNRLPEKALIEFLRVAGVQPLPPISAKAMLEFEVAEGTSESVLVGRGFQVGAQPATGEGDLVIFETERNLYAAPATIEGIFVQAETSNIEVDVKSDDPNFTFLAFGKQPKPGGALLIGLESEIVPRPFLTFGISVAKTADVPQPVSSGGVGSTSALPPPVLRWEILNGTSYEPADVVIDETQSLLQSGIVELRIPRQWRPGRPTGIQGEKLLRWIRLRFVFGLYRQPPVLSFVKLNIVQALAAQTIRDEILEHVSAIAGSAQRAGNTRMRLSQTPVLPGSVILEVSEGEFEFAAAAQGPAEAASLEVLEEESTEDTSVRRWRAVDDLSQYGPEDKVYVLDPVSGEITFGDGMKGASVPIGFRNVRAARYRVGGGAAGAVAAEDISNLLSSAPSIKSVKNPLPASGGSDAETQELAVRRGPQEIRARNRAVTTADYALLALRAPGACIERAHAIAGLHPALPGTAIPGVVAVFVVPPDRGEGPPIPDEQTLRAVAEYLTENVAPVGVEVVASAPNYHRVRAEVSVVIDAGSDVSTVVRAAITSLDDYLHPLKGGEDAQGWPFGSTLQYTAILQRLVSNVKGVLAVPRLNIVVNGVRTPRCSDYKISANSLFWPEGHEVVVVEPGESE